MNGCLEFRERELSSCETAPMPSSLLKKGHRLPEYADIVS